MRIELYRREFAVLPVPLLNPVHKQEFRENLATKEITIDYEENNITGEITDHSYIE